MSDRIDELDFFALTARVKRLSDRLYSDARKIYNYLGLDVEPNWHLVFTLLKEDDLSVTEISGQLGFSHPAIIKITQKMREKGFVASYQDKLDARKQLLTLTKKSRALLPTLEKEWARIQSVIKTCAGDEFLAQIRRFDKAIEEKSTFERFVDAHE